ncbi:hypothetical protein C8R43DRAFT_995120 [Mycena crocata]|nr:hypothetical protein C8R43DRAFT_995120 [Mycena crocata]
MQCHVYYTELCQNRSSLATPPTDGLRPTMKHVTVVVLPVFLPFTLASFIVNTIKAKALTCEPVLLQWQGGVAPWTLSIIGNDGVTFENLGTFKSTSFHWNVDVEAGTAVAARVTDSTGATAESNSFIIQPGSTGCQIDKFVVEQPDSTSASQFLIPSSSISTPSSTGTSLAATAMKQLSSTSESRAIFSTAASASATSILTPSMTASIMQIFEPTTPAVIGTNLNSSPTPSLAATSAAITIKAGMVIAVLVPCLIFLVILGLWFTRWRRRRLQTPRGLWDLEAQAPPARWFDRPAYRSTFLNRRNSSEINTLGVARPTDIIVAPLAAAALSPESAPTPDNMNSDSAPPLASPSKMVASNPTPADVGTLQSRIHALLEENAVLATLAAYPINSPPPAYA